jgi:hypothetical protein
MTFPAGPTPVPPWSARLGIEGETYVRGIRQPDEESRIASGRPVTRRVEFGPNIRKRRQHHTVAALAPGPIHELSSLANEHRPIWRSERIGARAPTHRDDLPSTNEASALWQVGVRSPIEHSGKHPRLRVDQEHTYDVSGQRRDKVRGPELSKSDPRDGPRQLGIDTRTIQVRRQAHERHAAAQSVCLLYLEVKEIPKQLQGHGHAPWRNPDPGEVVHTAATRTQGSHQALRYGQLLNFR